MTLEWERVTPGHYLTDRFEIVRLPGWWELTDRLTGDATKHSSLKTAKAAAETAR